MGPNSTARRTLCGFSARRAREARAGEELATAGMGLDVGQAILATASLSFIGIGPAPPTPEWGAMVTEARAHHLDAWGFPTFPGLAIWLAVRGFNLLGDGLRGLRDQKMRS